MPDDQYKEPLTDEEKLEKVKQYRADGISGSGDQFDRMAKSEDYSVGRNQWNPETKAASDRKGKFSLTIPIIKPQVNSVAGSHIQNPQDFRVYPLRDGSETIGWLLTSLLKHATDSELYRYQENIQFRAGVQSGEGDMLFSLDWSRDPKHADLKIEKINEHQVMWDPNCTVYDPNQRRAGAKYVIWEPWVDKDLMHAEYPAKAEELKSLGGAGGTVRSIMGHMGSIIQFLTGGTQETSGTSFRTGEGTDNISKYRYQVNHTWWRWPKKCVLWYDKRKSELDAKLLIEEKDIWAAKKLTKMNPEVFEVEDVIRNIMHHTIRVGNVFLEDKVDELNGCQMFPIGRYNAYFDNGYISCPAGDLIGVQDMINYTHSAELNILKQMPNAGIIIGADTTNTYAQELADHAGEDGYVFEKDKAGGFIDFKEATPPPSGFHIFTEKCIEYAKMITGIRMVDPATDKDRVMGTVIAKQRASNKDQAVIHSNWNYTQSIAGNLLVEIIRFNGIYSEDEIRQIVSKDELIDKVHLENARMMVRRLLEEQGVAIPDEAPPVQIENLQNVAPEIQQAAIDQYNEDVAKMQRLAAQIDQVAMPIAEQMLIDDIRDMKKGKYSTKVSLSPASETARMTRYFELIETNKMLIEGRQLPIGRKFLIDMLDLPNKDEIIAEGEQQMKQMQAG